MQRHHLTIEGQKFYLPEDADADALGARLVQAARNGGELVTIDIVGSRTLRIVATPGPPIVIESEEVEEEDPSAVRLESPPPDYLNEL